MKGFLLAYGQYGKSFLRSLAICSVFLAVPLLAQGQGMLIIALFCGYFVGLLYWGSLFLTLWQAVQAAQGEGHVSLGPFLRLLGIMLAFTIAIKLSWACFLAVLGGFSVFVILAMIYLIIFNYRNV